MRYHLASESVTEGHPDKVCDFIADSLLDAYIAGDPRSRVACEVLCKNDLVVLAGEITSSAKVDHEAVARAAIAEVGYVDPSEPFHASGVRVHQILTKQASEIAFGVDAATNPTGEQGAGDQGIMFGYATVETPELMPLPIVLAHRLARALADDRRGGRHAWLRPDGKTQVSVEYDENGPIRVSSVLVSTQHAASVDQSAIREYVIEDLSPRALGEWHAPEIVLQGQPRGTAGAREGPGPIAASRDGRSSSTPMAERPTTAGEPSAARTRRRSIAAPRTSAGTSRARSSKRVSRAAPRSRSPTRSAIPRPFSIKVETYGTGDPLAARDFVKDRFDFRPAEIIRHLDLLRPIYRQTTNYGHLGKPGLPWEV